MESSADMQRSDDENAQDSLEYLMVIGAVVVVMMAFLIAGFYGLVPDVVGWVCPSVDTADPLASLGSCLGI